MYVYGPFLFAVFLYHIISLIFDLLFFFPTDGHPINPVFAQQGSPSSSSSVDPPVTTTASLTSAENVAAGSVSDPASIALGNMSNNQLSTARNRSASLSIAHALDVNLSAGEHRKSSLPAIIPGVTYVALPPAGSPVTLAAGAAPLVCPPAILHQMGSDRVAFIPQQLPQQPVSSAATILSVPHVIPGMVESAQYSKATLLPNHRLSIMNGNIQQNQQHTHLPVIAPAPPGSNSQRSSLSGMTTTALRDQFTLTSLASSLQFVQSSLTSSSRMLSSMQSSSHRDPIKVSVPSLATIVESVPKVRDVFLRLL